MKKLILITATLIAAALLYFWNDIRGFDTLDKAVQSHWKTPIKIFNEDKTNKLVLYLDQTQYVFGVYGYRNGRYYYDNSQSSGWTASSDRGIPFLVRAEAKNNRGNFLWGALYTEIPIGKFVIEYNNGETQETKAINNTFIIKMPKSYDSYQEINLMGELFNVKAYGEDNKEIQNWRN
jgi:hypothetical protein